MLTSVVSLKALNIHESKALAHYQHWVDLEPRHSGSHSEPPTTTRKVELLCDGRSAKAKKGLALSYLWVQDLGGQGKECGVTEYLRDSPSLPLKSLKIFGSWASFAKGWRR